MDVTGETSERDNLDRGDGRRSVAIWARGLGHLLRNQQTVLTNALFALEHPGPEPLSDADRVECMELGNEGLSRSLSLLDAFSALAFPRELGLIASPADLLRHVEVLIEPRVRRKEATLRIEEGGITAAVASVGASALLGTVCERALEALLPGSELTLGLVAEGGATRLSLGLRGVPSSEWDSLVAELEEVFQPSDDLRRDEDRCSVRLPSPEGESA